MKRSADRGTSWIDREQRSALVVVCGILALTFLDTTVVSVALGSIQSTQAAGVTGLHAHLTGDLSDRLNALGIPANFQSIVINAVENGSVPSGGNAPSGAQSSFGDIVNKVIAAAYGAFRAGLETALITSAILVAAAGGLAAFAALRNRDSRLQ